MASGDVSNGMAGIVSDPVSSRSFAVEMTLGTCDGSYFRTGESVSRLI